MTVLPPADRRGRRLVSRNGRCRTPGLAPHAPESGARSDGAVGSQLYSIDFRKMLRTIARTAPMRRGRDSRGGRPRQRTWHSEDRRNRPHHPLRREAARDLLPALVSEIPGTRPACLASMGIYIFSRRFWKRQSPTRSWSTSAGTSSPTPSRTSAYMRTSIAATGRTSGQSIVLPRPTWLCASRFRLLISTTPPVPSSLTRAFCPRPNLNSARFTMPSSRKAASCRAEIDHAVIGIRSRIGRNVRVHNSLIIGADSYETLDEIGATLAPGYHRSESVRIRSSRALSSTRTPASAVAFASSTKPRSRRRTGTAISSARGS